MAGVMGVKPGLQLFPLVRESLSSVVNVHHSTLRWATHPDGVQRPSRAKYQPSMPS